MEKDCRPNPLWLVTLWSYDVESVVTFQLLGTVSCQLLRGNVPLMVSEMPLANSFSGESKYSKARSIFFALDSGALVWLVLSLRTPRIKAMAFCWELIFILCSLSIFAMMVFSNISRRGSSDSPPSKYALILSMAEVCWR